MSLFSFLLPYFASGVIFALVAILIEKVLILNGWFRGNTVFLAISVFILSIIFELIKFPQPISINVVDILIFFIIAPLKLNQTDFIETIQKGRWWWKEKNHQPQ